MSHISNTLFRLLLGGVVVVMASCIKYYDIVKSEFPQGNKTCGMMSTVLSYMRSERVYNQFETQATFDVLWLADDVRTAYVDLYCDRRGLGLVKKEEMLKRQLEENNHWIAFYVLADIRDKVAASLSDPNAAWVLCVYINGDKDSGLAPESVKEVELEPEYQHFFGKRFNLFKTAYLVKVSITEDLVTQLQNRSYNDVTLVVSSPYKECCLVWEKSDVMKAKMTEHRDEDFYWG